MELVLKVCILLMCKHDLCIFNTSVKIIVVNPSKILIQFKHVMLLQNLAQSACNGKIN